ncbi:MAG TPA: hypothetical protein VG432_13935 [Gemmatimonadaceae bacterium]|nr:hypothetical protein [Gemmatimonadaceae bacterium]
MTNEPAMRPAVSLTRIAAVARLRLRRVVRTRLVLVALVLALLPWAIVESSSLIARLAALTSFTVVGLTALAAGAIADDLDSGEYAIATAHDVRPIEVLGGQAAAALGLAAALVAIQLPIAFDGSAIPAIAPLLLCMGWLAAFLAGWLALMLLLATLLDGKGNAVAMIPVLFLPLALGAGVLDRLPHLPAMLVRGVVQLLPQVDQATAMFRVALNRSPAPAAAPFVLLASPFLYFALASIRLRRIEPAGRLTQ